MILQRISEHIKSQNWFAVTVEFVIVVLGVFMGLQVQDWNDARKERIEESELLVRLYEETQALLAVQNEELLELRARSDGRQSRAFLASTRARPVRTRV